MRQLDLDEPMRRLFDDTLHECVWSVIPVANELGSWSDRPEMKHIFQCRIEHGCILGRRHMSKNLPMVSR